MMTLAVEAGIEEVTAQKKVYLLATTRPYSYAFPPRDAEPGQTYHEGQLIKNLLSSAALEVESALLIMAEQTTDRTPIGNIHRFSKIAKIVNLGYFTNSGFCLDLAGLLGDIWPAWNVNGSLDATLAEYLIERSSFFPGSAFYDLLERGVFDWETRKGDDLLIVDDRYTLEVRAALHELGFDIHELRENLRGTIYQFGVRTPSRTGIQAR